MAGMDALAAAVQAKFRRLAVGRVFVLHGRADHEFAGLARAWFALGIVSAGIDAAGAGFLAGFAFSAFRAFGQAVLDTGLTDAGRGFREEWKQQRRPYGGSDLLPGLANPLTIGLILLDPVTGTWHPVPGEAGVADFRICCGRGFARKSGISSG